MATNTQTHLRKAAVLIRSLDSDTAAMMLGQLSAQEAAAIRAAMRELGPVGPEEQADIAAEFRRTRPAFERAAGGVELSLSTPPLDDNSRGQEAAVHTPISAGRRFEFVANASTSALVTFLGREHPQTIAVVLAHLSPDRAAEILAALPEKLQAGTIERLAALGEADSESVIVLERELATWLAARGEDRGVLAHRRETVANILAATDAKTRRGILSRLRTHNIALASQLAADDSPAVTSLDYQKSSDDHTRYRRVLRADSSLRPTHESKYTSKQAADTSEKIQRGLAAIRQSITSTSLQPPSPPPLPRIEFDQLVHLDAAGISALLHNVDANVLAVALVGSREDLVDRICGQMPKRTARTFRRELRRVGPTRLSDVEIAQRMVAEAAARHLASRRHTQVNAA